MLGAIAGDVIGSVYEHQNIKTVDFPLFSKYCHYTDDTVLTVALAETLLRGSPYVENLKKFYAFYPLAGFGGKFRQWAESESLLPFNSYGNGSAMRVSPVAYYKNDLESVLNEAKKSAEVTHNHPEGIKGAQAVAGAIFLARQGRSKDAIKAVIEEKFGYDLTQTLDEIRPTYGFDVSCQGSVPQALTAFLEGNSFEDTIRKAVSIGGDSDTIACISGSIAEAFFGGVPPEIAKKVYSLLDLRLARITREFIARYCYCFTLKERR